MLKETERLKEILKQKPLPNSMDDAAVEFATAAIQVAREYRELMIFAVIFSITIFTSYAVYRAYEKILYDRVYERIQILERNCHNAN